MTSINIVGVSIIGVFVLFIIGKKEKQLHDYLLIVTNVLIAIMLLSDAWIQADINSANFIIQNVTPFYLFSAFLTYGMLLISSEQRIKKDWWWFYIYSVAFTIFIGVDFIVLTNYNNDLLITRYLYPTSAYHFFYKTHSVFVIFVLIWFLKQLKAYQFNLKNYYSFIEPLRLNWLKTFTYIYIIINAVALVAFLSYNMGLVESIDVVYLLINSILVLSIFYLSYHGIRHYSIVQIKSANGSSIQGANTVNGEDADKKIIRGQKYQSSTLSHERMNKIFEDLTQLFSEESLFKEPQLKVESVANILDVSSHHLSQTINSKTGKPFYEFVNSSRVELLKEKLKNPDNHKFTILSLALDCGFNSKASLNRIFKQYTGTSPSQYQKAHLIK